MFGKLRRHDHAATSRRGESDEVLLLKLVYWSPSEDPESAVASRTTLVGAAVFGFSMMKLYGAMFPVAPVWSVACMPTVTVVPVEGIVPKSLKGTVIENLPVFGSVVPVSRHRVWRWY